MQILRFGAFLSGQKSRGEGGRQGGRLSVLVMHEAVLSSAEALKPEALNPKP